ncbi:MAG: NnrS family protein [Halioglobus sp.]|nr:NnrS family protein [Halioglobus sp.]
MHIMRRFELLKVPVMARLSSSPLLAFAFRPFFLLAALYGAVSVLLWVAWLLQLAAPLPAPLSSQWHAHEMLYGFVPAAIAGFLLTAITNWTGAAPLAGRPLGLLVGLWLLGRAAMWLQGLLPYALVAALDFAFLAVLAAYVARVLVRAGNRRNLGLVAVLLALALGNALMHAAVLLPQPGLGVAGRNLGLDIVTVLMIVIAGRITPAFSANWLRARGLPAPGAARPWHTPLAVGTAVVLALASLLGLPDTAVGVLAVAAAAANALRLVAWAGWRVWREPLLGILHLGYALIVVALGARGLFLVGLLDNPSLWYHALGVGAIGVLIVGVMTRVSMGHTGRPLRLLPGAGFIYLAIIAATALRLATAAAVLPYSTGLALSALAWAVGLLLFVALYGPILLRPRADGRPG